MAGKPPLELAVEVTDADGTRYRWDSQGRAENRPRGIGFGTKRGDGFGVGGCTLARDVDRDYNDINLFDDFAFIGADGSVAYEGRLAASPRTFGEDGQTISVALAGWMAHAKDRKFSEVYADRDLSRWGPVARARKVASALASETPATDPSVAPDATNNLASVLQSVTAPWAASRFPKAEAVYDAGPGLKVARIYYDWERNANATNTNWQWQVGVADGDDLSGSAFTGDLQSEPATTGVGYFTPATAKRFGVLQFIYNNAAADTGSAEFQVFWRNLAVYGNHGLTLYGSTDPGGFHASDVIKDIASRFCPKLNTAGVQDTSYVIPHLVFNRAFPFDGFLECNKYHLWDLGVWENKTLTFRPNDLTDYDWELRLDDPGVTVDFQGDSTEDLANGIVVTYQDVDTGKTQVLTPDDDSTLADTSVTNPANKWGIKRWEEATISTPTDAAGAAQIGRMLLAEFNAPKSPGVYRVKGHIKDRAGHWQQVWKVRAGDTVAITSSTSLSDRPHLIVETQYDHDSTTLAISVDNTLPRVDAILDRFGVALQANNLT